LPVRVSSLEQLPYVGLRTFCRALAHGSEDGRLVEVGGVTAAVVPAAPDRSIANSVMYDSVAGLESALDQIARAYDEAGVHAWTVWVPQHDRQGPQLLEQAGHKLDGEPTAMAMELKDFDRTPSPEIEIDEHPEPGELGRLNDRAYGFEGDQFARALALRPPGMHHYTALLDGMPVACLGAIDDARDCGIYFVATAPEAQGRGLATELMLRALMDACGRDCLTTSLQATKMGRPIYDRLGYRDFGQLQIWERRRA
jgi:GNAT superfamily N-acetyltransferase